MATQFSLGDYVDVKERINLALAKYPELSLQFEFKGVLESNPDFIWGIAYAYRTPDDPRPGIGTACELAIGKTTFSRGSEIMVLETSCWGRALGALGIGLGKSIATKQEVEAAQNRNANDDPWGEQTAIIKNSEAMDYQKAGQMTQRQYSMIKAMFNHDINAMVEYVQEFKQRSLHPVEMALTKSLASALIEELKMNGYKPMPNPNRNIDPESKHE